MVIEHRRAPDRRGAAARQVRTTAVDDAARRAGLGATAPEERSTWRGHVDPHRGSVRWVEA